MAVRLAFGVVGALWLSVKKKVNRALWLMVVRRVVAVWRVAPQSAIPRAVPWRSTNRLLSRRLYMSKISTGTTIELLLVRCLVNS